MPDNTIRGRFAPSPSGRLHLGNMLTFLLAWLDVRARGGTMVFRLEDLDPERSWEHYADLMADDLLWLGLDWDEGWRPGSQDCRQGTRAQRYTAALDALTERGMVYDEFNSKQHEILTGVVTRIDPRTGAVSLRIGTGTESTEALLLSGEQVPREAGCPCRTLSEQEVQKRLRMGRRAAKKLAVTDADIAFVDAHYGPQAAELRHGRDDFLIRRSDGVFAYQLAVSVDDLDMGITRVVRARDLLDSTPRQIWLMETLGGKAPEYAHAPLLVAPDGRKLSKREGDLNMEALRQKYTPEQLTGKLAKLAGMRQTDAPVTAIELAADFSWDKVPRADIPIPPDF